MGIHNEPGHQRISPIPSLSALVAQTLDLLTSTTDSERSFLPFKGHDNVVVLINNLGGLSELELGAVANEVVKDLSARGIVIKRIISGTFMVGNDTPW
jgi:triose/dihydroxyacetone kinase / FAD-AMP lyase (cyclizing)